VTPLPNGGVLQHHTRGANPTRVAFWASPVHSPLEGGRNPAIEPDGLRRRGCSYSHRVPTVLSRQVGIHRLYGAGLEYSPAVTPECPVRPPANGGGYCGGPAPPRQFALMGPDLESPTRDLYHQFSDEETLHGLRSAVAPLACLRWSASTTSSPHLHQLTAHQPPRQNW